MHFMDEGPGAILSFKTFLSFINRLKAMAPHSSTLAWKIPWMVEPGRLQSMGSLKSVRVGHNWATSLSLFTCMHWRRKWQPMPVFLPGESQGQRSLVVPSMRLHSRAWLKRLSSSSRDNRGPGTYLVVQWLRLHASTERSIGLIHGREVLRAMW